MRSLCEIKWGQNTTGKVMESLLGNCGFTLLKSSLGNTYTLLKVMRNLTMLAGNFISRESSALDMAAAMLSWAMMSLLFVVFYVACFNPSHQVVISVNSYGEMRIEAVLFAVIWIITTLNVIKLMRRYHSSQSTVDQPARDVNAQEFPLN